MSRVKRKWTHSTYWPQSDAWRTTFHKSMKRIIIINACKELKYRIALPHGGSFADAATEIVIGIGQLPFYHLSLFVQSDQNCMLYGA